MNYKFEEYVLDAARRELTKDGERVALEPQVFDLLAYLIAERARVVSRDDLTATVWKGRIVSEATLSSRLNAARVAIGDSGAEQRLIRTLPRKGVRFVGEAQETTAAAPLNRSTPRLPSVAVLAFANLSGDPDQDYFADGVADEIISALSRASGLTVIARSSSFSYKGRVIDVRRIREELGVDYVLDGSVRRDRGQLRITGQLIDAASGAHLWSDRFDGDLHDVFSLQERVAASAAAAIEPTLQTAERNRLAGRPSRLDVYELWLRAHAGLAEFTAAGMASALARLREALALEPDYAPALAAVAYARGLCHFQGWIAQTAADRAEAVSFAWRAIERAPNDAQVLWMSAFAIWNMAGTDKDRARELFRRSLLLNPNSAMALTLSGWIETMCGASAEGRAMAARAQRLNPRDPNGWLVSGVMALAAVVEENYAEAIAWAERALAQNRQFAVALRVVAVSSIKLGRLPLARKAVRDLLTVEPNLTVSELFARIPFPLASMAKVYAEALKQAGLPD